LTTARVIGGNSGNRWQWVVGDSSQINGNRPLLPYRYRVTAPQTDSLRHVEGRFLYALSGGDWDGVATVDFDGYVDEAEIVGDEFGVVVGILGIGRDHGDLGRVNAGTH